MDADALAKAVQSVLAKAKAEGMESVAIPVIGNGNAGWPTELAAKVHVEEALKFAKARVASSSTKVRKQTASRKIHNI